MTTDGVLVVAVAFKKEYLAVPLEDFPLNDEKWHSIEIVHSKVPSQTLHSIPTVETKFLRQIYTTEQITCYSIQRKMDQSFIF